MTPAMDSLQRQRRQYRGLAGQLNDSTTKYSQRATENPENKDGPGDVEFCCPGHRISHLSSPKKVDLHVHVCMYVCLFV